jgi:tetratricopeptide (TPR) repeat protein
MVKIVRGVVKNRLRASIAILGCAALVLPPLARRVGASSSEATLVIDYPSEGSIFPPEITPPTFLFRDSTKGATAWQVEVKFSDGGVLRAACPCEHMRIGEIDPRAVSETNEPPRLTPQQAAARTWMPDAGAWAEIKKRSVERAAEVTITGFRDQRMRHPVSRGSVTLTTSRDPVGAPIFYRDVPLMPSELEKGIIKPLAQAALPLIAWQLRNVGETRGRVLLEGQHVCANCHSFSSDGKTLGMDLDGPQNDKGLYAIAAVEPRMSIRDQDVIAWSSFKGQPAGQMRVGFMSRISPDGQYVVTTVGAEKDIARNYYVANFKDYRFLQVFYATRGILVVYNRASKAREPLPGADDRRFVQTNATWSPDGRYLVFARAEAREAYPPGRPLALFANDPNETQVQYDLYRIPFNGGKGGVPEPISGASLNGMSNSFPKVSPDGRWIVFVQARNGLLMRPDSRLYIVPAQGGQARRMRCNQDVMNSWHSFSPNGRWLVFSSKARSPYTQMYLTHIDEEGRDSPAILIENATASNRAVNIPEFVNIPQDGLQKLEVPAADFYNLFDRAFELGRQGRHADAADLWRQALAIDPDNAKANNNMGFVLANLGRLDEAIAHWRKALEADSEYAEVHKNLARALSGTGRFEESIPHWRKAVELEPADGEARYNFGVALLRQGNAREAIEQYRHALAIDASDPQTHNDLGVALLQQKQYGAAAPEFQRAIALAPRFAQAYFNLGSAYYLLGRAADALVQWRQGLALEPDNSAALSRTAWIQATSPDDALRNGAEAVRSGARAVELTGQTDAAALDSLAAAYAEAGRFPDAVETARRALTLAERQNKAALAGAIRARLALYQGQTPFRETPAQR